MTSLIDYRTQVKEELDNEEIPDCKILIAYEIMNLNETLCKLMEVIESSKLEDVIREIKHKLK